MLIGLFCSIFLSSLSSGAVYAAGTAYAVGDIGPGGGKVFYTSVTAFTETGAPCGSNCHYLEWAPTTWASNNNKNNQFLFDQPNYYGGGTGTALGTGYNNTLLLARDNSASNYVTNALDAPRLVRAYRGGSQSDWFIPSAGEWYLISQSSVFSTGGFTGGDNLYWTSTANNVGPGTALQLHTVTGSSGAGDPGLQPPYRLFPVRPIRAFGDSVALADAPTSVVATSTGSTTASVSFMAPASDGGATITSYTATSSPGGITGTISQVGSGTISMTGLLAGTTYSFTVKATNSVGESVASSASNSITTTTPITAPNAPTTVVAIATGKRSATVSFAAPTSNGGSIVTAYIATSTPGGISKTLAQATGGTITFDGLQPAITYTFTVVATNTIGTSTSSTSNSIKTDSLVPASLSSLSFIDDGTGTGGMLVWTGKNIDSVLYTGSAVSYPGPYTYGAFTSSWNGHIRNLTPGTEYTVSIYALSTDGVGVSNSLTFKTSAVLPSLVGTASSTTATISPAQADAVKLALMILWVNENTFLLGEAANISNLLTKFMSIETSAHRSFVKVPTSRVSTVMATSLTPKSCSVVSTTAKVDAGMVKALTKDTCTISYTVSGPSKAPATLVKDFVFKKVN